MDAEILAGRLAAVEDVQLKQDERIDALVQEKVDGHLAGHGERMNALEGSHTDALQRIAATEERILHCLERLEETNEVLTRIEAEGNRLLAEIAAEEKTEVAEEEAIREEVAELPPVEEVPVEQPAEPVKQPKAWWEMLFTSRSD